MTTQSSLSIPVIQMGYAEKIAEVAQNQQGIQQDIAVQLTSQELDKKRSQVTPIEKNSDKADLSVSEEGAQDKFSHFAEKKKKRAIKKKKEEVQSTQDELNPFSGNILNLNI